VISRNLKQGERVLALLQESYPGYHPLIGVAKIAHTTDDPRLEFDCHKTLSRYVETELKAVEVSQAPPDSGLLKVVFEGEFEDISPDDGTAALDNPERLPADDVLEMVLDVPLAQRNIA
jgi:hypothetical protein